MNDIFVRDLLARCARENGLTGEGRKENALAPEVLGALYEQHRLPQKTAAFRAQKAHAAHAPDMLPAATQLFTPAWMADFLAQNALETGGRYAQYAAKKPEPVKLLDPCMGGGQLLLSAFDCLLPHFPPREILSMLYGLDVDENVAALARGALKIKATLYDKSIWTDPPEIHLYALPRDDIQAGALKDDPFGITKLRFDVILLNPPYMGARAMPPRLRAFVTENYPAGRSDLYAAFILRAGEMLKSGGVMAVLCQMAFLTLRTCAPLREILLRDYSIQSMVQLGARAFTALRGDIVRTLMCVMKKTPPTDGTKGIYIDVQTAQDKEKAFFDENRRRVLAQKLFLSMPENMLLPAMPPQMPNALANFSPLKKYARVCQGLATGDNARFVRLWHEVPREEMGIKYFPYNKGGRGHRWYGCREYVVDWENKGDAIKHCARSAVRGEKYYFKPCVSWSKVASGAPVFRRRPQGEIFDVAGCCIFCEDEDLLFYLLAFLNSAPARRMLTLLCPTMNYEVGRVRMLPTFVPDKKSIRKMARLARENVFLCREGEQEREESPDFTHPPFLPEN